MNSEDNNKIKNVREKLKNVIYVGVKESDSKFTNYKNSITLFGSGNKSNYALNKECNKRLDHNDIKKNGEIQGEFFANKIISIIKGKESCNTCYYNKHIFYSTSPYLQSYGVFEVSQSLYEFFNDKILSKIWANNVVPCLDNKFLYGDEINYENCLNMFDAKIGTQFVVQARDSLSGSGTFLFNSINCDNVIKKIKSDEKYVISKYLENGIPVNVHILIAKNDYIILPPSIQLINLVNNNFSYEGADFCSYKYIINQGLQNKIITYTKRIVKNMQQMGYIGVAGIDFICSKDEAYFMEINARYQSSTIVLNYALHENNLPTVNELDAMCFMYDKLINLPKIDVSYSKIAIHQGEKDNYTDKDCIIFNDGYSQDEKLEDNVYLYTKIIKGGIYKK